LNRGAYNRATAAARQPCPFGADPGARAYFRRLRQRADIAKPITPHKLRHTYATNLLNAGAERVDIQALLGHESVATIQIDTHVGQDWMVAAARLCRKNAIRRYSG
jgi:integrase/recombinase XerD